MLETLYTSRPTIIAGSRDITDPGMLDAALVASGWHRSISRVVCGMAPGADMLGRAWAKANDIPVDEYPADWKAHGKAGGPIRNGQMAEVAQALLALWDGQSLGTANMIKQARQRGLLVYVYTSLDYARKCRVLVWGEACRGLPRHRWPSYEYEDLR